MKKNLIILIIITTTGFGCNKFLDKEPLSQISRGSFWTTEVDLILGVNNLYTGINHSWSVDNQSADFYGNAPNGISSGTNVAGNTDEVWTRSYTQINRAHEFLQNYNKAQVSEAIKNRYAGEARFFRAFNYFELIKRFGDVPLLTKTIDLASPELYGPRTARNIVRDSIIADLQWAITNLPFKNQLKPTEIGRITKGVASALLSRVALNEGTWMKSRNISGWEPLLTIAKNAAKDVMQSGQYSLFNNFQTLFYFANEDNQEVILSYRYNIAVSGTNYNPRIRAVLLDGSMVPTKLLADAFRSTDGLPINLSAQFQGYGTLSSEFTNRDPRMAMTIWKPGDTYNISAFKPDIRTTRTGYWTKKYADPIGFTTAFVFTDEILIRYAEVLLNYAEATYELSNSISDDDLNLSVNLLRGRPGVVMPALTNAFVNGVNPAAAMLSMREEIRNERRIELAGEGFRYDDLIRWKTAETELPQKDILGIQFRSADYPTIVVGRDVKLTTDGFIIVQAASSKSFVSPKNYLFPIPLREISLNGSLIQNEGW